MTSVCVVVPNKNGLALLGPSLDSVLAQDFDPMSVLVVDNISSDGSYELALDYAARDARVTVVQNDVDVNYYGSLNRALATTTAEYLVPFANDDFMEPGNLARKVALLEQTGAGFAHSSATRIDGDGRTIDVCPDHFAIPEVLGAGEFVP